MSNYQGNCFLLLYEGIVIAVVFFPFSALLKMHNLIKAIPLSLKKISWPQFYLFSINNLMIDDKPQYDIVLALLRHLRVHVLIGTFYLAYATRNKLFQRD